MLFLVSTFRAQQQSSNATSEQEFLAAVPKGEREQVPHLLNKTPALVRAPDRNGVSPILLATYNGRKEVVDVLLSENVELNIFEAAATGQTNRIRTLVSGDRYLANSFASDGFTPLGLASFFGYKEAAASSEAGANVNLRSNNGLKAVPLQSAAVTNQLDIARLLLARRADPNSRGEGGYTPLHEVAAGGHLEFVKLLLEHGAKVNAKGDDGKTPLTIAIESKQVQIAEFLRSRGALQ